MLSFEKKTKKFIETHDLIAAKDILVIAVSGGPDSMALLDYFVKNRHTYGITIVVAHVDHMLRGEDSKEDLDYVRAYCLQQDLAFEAKSIPIREKMEADRLGLQETARKYRYQFLQEVMKKYRATKLAVAQHGDDQIESILMRLTRGSTGAARAGILVKRPFASGELIRPLLGVIKKEIEEYCEEMQLSPREDSSNQSLTYTRNRFRHKIVPFLKEENPRVHEQFQRFSEELHADEMFLYELAQGKMNEICKELNNEQIRIEISPFNSMPLPLQRRVIQLILNYLYNHKEVEITALHMDSIQNVLKGENPSAQLDFPNHLKVIRSYNECIFTFRRTNCLAKEYVYELTEGENVYLPNGSSFQLTKGNTAIDTNDDHCMCIHPQDVDLPLIIRTRKPGDRIQLKGMNGNKKVKQLFIDLKIPINDRTDWPIVTDQKGTILWIPGLRKSKYELSQSKEQCYYKLYYQLNI